jgi:hypothetical protein
MGIKRIGRLGRLRRNIKAEWAGEGTDNHHRVLLSISPTVLTVARVNGPERWRVPVTGERLTIVRALQAGLPAEE